MTRIFAGACYKIINESMRWATAVQRCASIHDKAELASIRSYEEAYFVKGNTMWNTILASCKFYFIKLHEHLVQFPSNYIYLNSDQLVINHSINTMFIYSVFSYLDLLSNAGAKQYWLGGTDLQKEGDWRWTDGSLGM